MSEATPEQRSDHLCMIISLEQSFRFILIYHLTRVNLYIM